MDLQAAARAPASGTSVHDAAEKVLSRAYRNGTVANYTYNSNDWVLSPTHKMGATLIAGFNYPFDNEGDKAYEQKLHDTAHSEGYSYDSVDRLIDYQVGTLVGSTITMVVTQTAYNLDPLGNWKSRTTDTVTQNRPTARPTGSRPSTRPPS
jgi:hypothetical protein